MVLFNNNDPRGRRSRAGRVFFDEFSTRFWELPSNINISNLNFLFILYSNTNCLLFFIHKEMIMMLGETRQQ
jgi:hypothetical protein